VSFFIDPRPQVKIIYGPNLTAEEARQYLEVKNGGPMDGAIVDLILSTLGTRIIDLMELHRVLKSKINDRKQVENYLQSRLGSAATQIGKAIATHPKMLDLFMELDKRNELATPQVMRIMGVRDLATLQSMDSLLAKTKLVLYYPEENKLTFDGTFVRSAFGEWKRKIIGFVE
jgi:hypothetical protein